MATRTASAQPPKPTPSRLRTPVDTVLFATTLALVAFGFWMVFGTSFFQSMDSPKLGNDPFFFVKRQTAGAIMGGFALCVMMRTGYWNLKTYALPILFGCLILLALVWPLHFPGLAIKDNGAWRWLGHGSARFQPSELAKLGIIIYLASMYSRSGLKIRNFESGLLPPLIPAILALILIEREPDLGTAMVLFAAVGTILAVAGARRRHLALFVGLGLIAVLLFGFAFGHRGSRIQTYVNPCQNREFGGDQVCNSLYAVGSGGLLGEGIGQGKQKYLLTQANCDFIFATIAEELGFFRASFVLLGLMIVGWRGFRIAYSTKDRFGSLLASGIAALISWQALINVGVATGSIPATGVPLPFISYGSSSLVLLMGGIGILLNIAQYPEGEPAPLQKRRL